MAIRALHVVIGSSFICLASPEAAAALGAPKASVVVAEALVVAREAAA